MKCLKELECLKSNLLLQNGEKINIENQYQLNILPPPNGANVNMDIPEFNNATNGVLGNGPHQPHIGYQNAGKDSNRIREHIFVDELPATRR